MRKPYVMSNSVLMRYARSGRFPICANPACGAPIKVGEWVQPVYMVQNGVRKPNLYHLDCYEGIWID